MRCLKCGADIVGDQSFCTSCGAKVTRGNTYELYLPGTTSSKRALNLTMEITHKNLEQVGNLLSRPHSVILTGLSLNKAAELKSKYMRLGVAADFRRTADHVKIDHFNNSHNFSNHSFNEDSVFKIPDKSAENQPENKPVAKKYKVVEDVVIPEDNGNSDLMRLLLLIIAIIVIILGIITAVLYSKKQNEIKTVPADKSILPSKNIELPQLQTPKDKFKQSFSDGLAPAESASEKKQIQSKGSNYQPASPQYEEKIKEEIASILNQQAPIERDELNKKLDQIESEDLQNEILADISKVKDRIGNLKQKLEKNISNGAFGDIELTGNRFNGIVNLPDRTKVEITVRRPDNKTRTESQTISNYTFVTEPLDTIQPGNYRVTVHLADLADQLEELRGKLAGILKSLNQAQKGQLIDKVITNKEYLLATQTLSSPEVKTMLTNMMTKYFGPVNAENQVLVDEENIIIKGRSKDVKQFIIQAAAGIGFASRQSNWLVSNLIIIVNNRKYKIPVKICRESMQLVNDDYRNTLFSESILANLQ